MSRTDYAKEMMLWTCASLALVGGTAESTGLLLERTMRMNVPKTGADTRASTPEGEPTQWL
jgi:hypothetical protein